MFANQINPIVSKYWCALTTIRGEGQDDSAILLALTLAVEEAAHTTPPPQTDSLASLVKQIDRLNDWLFEHAPDLAHDPYTDTADAILIALTRLTLGGWLAEWAGGDLHAAITHLRTEMATVDQLRTEIAIANDDRTFCEEQLGILTAWLRDHDLANDERNEVAIAITELEAQRSAISDMHAQLLTLDADNARLIHEIATLRSPAPTSNGGMDALEFGAVTTTLPLNPDPTGCQRPTAGKTTDMLAPDAAPELAILLGKIIDHNARHTYEEWRALMAQALPEADGVIKIEAIALPSDVAHAIRLLLESQEARCHALTDSLVMPALGDGGAVDG